MVVLLLPDLACVLICGVAVVTDLRTRQIPNWLTLPGVLLGLALNFGLFALQLGPAAGARLGLLSAASGGLLALLVVGLFGALRLVGMGDVKLMVAVGTLLRWPVVLQALAYTALAGGLVGVGYAVAQGRLGPVLRNLLSIGRAAVRRQPPSPDLSLHRIPYGLAIFLGASGAAAGKYLALLRHV